MIYFALLCIQPLLALPWHRDMHLNVSTSTSGELEVLVAVLLYYFQFSVFFNLLRVYR